MEYINLLAAVDKVSKELGVDKYEAERMIIETINSKDQLQGLIARLTIKEYDIK